MQRFLSTLSLIVCIFLHSSLSASLRNVTDETPGFVRIASLDGKAFMCYRPLTILAGTWDQGNSICQQYYGPSAHLAVLNDQNTNQLVKNALHSLTSPAHCYNSGITPSYFIALARTVRGNCNAPFYWQPTPGNSIQPSYYDWGLNQPDCFDIGSFGPSCAVMDLIRGYQWKDIGCDKRVCFICQYTATVC